jgi:ribosomal protein S18 acetylase RimI-like enzyme
METYEHTTPSPLLQNALHSNLPHSINLVYRTQHKNRTATAHVLATFSPSAATTPRCWAAAYFDQSMRPETDLWIFATGQIPGHSSEDDSFCADCRRAVYSLLDYMSKLPVPPLHPSNQPSLDLARQHEKAHPESGAGVKYPMSAGAYMRHLLIPSVVTLGACHEKIVQVIADAGLVREEFPGREALLNKFLFKVSDLPETRDLPKELRWGEMREQNIATVQARTDIPRTARTLLSLKSVGVFEKAGNKAVAWTFLGLDGSLTTLHTEPEYRGRGIAKAVAAKIFREHAPGLAVDDEGNAWAHGDVYVGNVQSESVCRSLGGRPGMRIFWVRIDLAGAGALAR